MNRLPLPTYDFGSTLRPLRYGWRRELFLVWIASVRELAKSGAFSR